MNKTVTVNISGFVFYIEENAYAVLATYLSRIKAIFQSDEGGDEILNDVEARIAELFHEKLADKKEVVTIKDVEQVIQVMGKPEDYTDDTSFENANHSSGAGASSNHYTNEKRKIYRDSDDKVLGGVCSGFGHYFDIDPIILRIAVVLLVVFGGFGLPLYIILWIVIPKAETTSEKLRMHGEKINVESIKKKVTDFSNSASVTNTNRRARSFLDRLLELLGTIFGALGRIILKLIGVFFAILAIGLLIGLVAALLSPDSVLNINDNCFSIAEIREMIFHGNANFFLSTTGVTLLILTPIIGLIYGAIRILSGNRYAAKGLGTSLIILFIIGIFSASTGIIRTVHGYHEDGTSEEIMSSSSDTENLHVMLLPDDEFHSNLNLDGEDTPYWEVMKLTENQFINGQGVSFETKDSKSDDFKIKIIKKSQGRKSLEAINFAENISFYSELDGDTLKLSPYIRIPREDGYRSQRLEIVVYVPEGKRVTLDKNTSRIQLKNVKKGRAYIFEDGYKLDFNENYLPKSIEIETDSLKNYKL